MTIQSRITNDNNKIKVFKIKVEYTIHYLSPLRNVFQDTKELSYTWRSKDYPNYDTIEECINKVVISYVANLNIISIKQIKEN